MIGIAGVNESLILLEIIEANDSHEIKAFDLISYFY